MSMHLNESHAASSASAVICMLVQFVVCMNCMSVPELDLVGNKCELTANVGARAGVPEAAGSLVEGSES